MGKDPIEMFGRSPGASGGGGGSDGFGGGGKPPGLNPLERINIFKLKWVKLLAVLAVLFLFFFNSLFVYIRPNEYGIKVVKIGTSRGVQKEVYEAGLHFVPPGLQEMYRLPREMQVLELTNYPESAARGSRVEKAAHIQTSDGFFVDVDVSILYHIEDTYKVFTRIGPGALFMDNGIIPKTEPVLKETLGKLTTEEFYNSPMRVERAMAAKGKLNQELSEKGLKVDQLLIRYFRYSDEIQKNIEEKKLKDQLVFKNQAEGRAATEEAKLKKVVQEGEMNVAVKMAEGDAYETKRLAEKDLYVRKMRARADLLVQLAEANRTKLRNEALQGFGSDRMVGLEMAKNLKGLDVIILPSDGAGGVNPLDMGKILDLFEVRKGGERRAAPGGEQ